MDLVEHALKVGAAKMEVTKPHKKKSQTLNTFETTLVSKFQLLNVKLISYENMKIEKVMRNYIRYSYELVMRF